LKWHIQGHNVPPRQLYMFSSSSYLAVRYNTRAQGRGGDFGLFASSLVRRWHKTRKA
ncbi:hypothetical protein JRQ81_006956, partial [Phrynocephalus forsythii]